MATVTKVAPTNVQDLPHDVLNEIFFAVLGPRTGGTNDRCRRRRPVLLSHTCRTWRAQALATPSLWTDVLISGVSKLYFSFFHRSSPLLVDVTLSMPNTVPLEGELSVGAAILRFLKENFERERELVSRIRSLHLTVPGGGRTAFVLDAFDFLRFTNLTSFQVGAVNRYPLGPVELPQAPNLQMAKLLEVSPALTPLPNTITKLTLASKEDPLYTSTFRQIINDLPRLETLILELDFRAHEVHTTWEPPAPIHARYLKRLAVTSISGANDYTPSSGDKTPCPHNKSCLLGRLVAKRLEYLEIEFWNSLRHLTNLIESTTQPLTLMVNQAFSPTGEDLDLFNKLASNIHLRVISPPGSDCEDCIDFYLARADDFSSMAVYTTDGHRVEEYGSHVFMPPRPALEPLIIHAQENILNDPSSAVDVLPDPAMPYLYPKPPVPGTRKSARRRRDIWSQHVDEHTSRCHHWDKEVDTSWESDLPDMSGFGLSALLHTRRLRNSLASFPDANHGCAFSMGSPGDLSPLGFSLLWVAADSAP